MVDKKLWHQEDDTLQAGIDQDIKDTEEYDLLNVQYADKHNGELPKNRLDLGRNCPRCLGRLAVKEITEKNENVYLFCKSCGLQVFAEDIDYQDDISNQLYQTIPLTVQNRWNTYREKYRKRS